MYPAFQLAAATALSLGGSMMQPGAIPAAASGPTVHTRVGAVAAGLVGDQELMRLLQLTQKTHFGRGLLFPDTFGVPGLHAELDIQKGHEDEFLNDYIRLLVGRCGSDWLTLSPANSGCCDLFSGCQDECARVRECRELTAHFMGTLGHVVTDMRFDRYFLRRVDEQCAFDGSGGSFHPAAQDFTDRALDTAVAPQSAWFFTRPDFGGVPGPYDEPFSDCVGDYPACLNPLYVIYTTYPATLNFPALTFVGLDSAAQTHVNLTLSLQGAAAYACTPLLCPHVCYFDPFIEDGCFLEVQTRCWWAYRNLDEEFGGVYDSGEILAQYFDKTWEILESGGVPIYEACGGGAYGQRFSVVDGLGRAFDYSSWVAVPQAGVDVSKFRIVDGPSNAPYAAHSRVYWLTNSGELYTYEEPFDRPRIDHTNTRASLVLSDVVDFEVDGERIGVLVNQGPPGPGHELLVMESWNTAAVTVARDVVDFQLGSYVDSGVGTQRIAFLEQRVDAMCPTLKAMDGPLGSTTVSLITGLIDEVQLEGDRIGVLRSKSAGTAAPRELLVMQGPLAAEWTSLEKGRIAQFQLATRGSLRQVWVLQGDELSVTEGPLGSDFVLELSDVSEFQAVRGWVAALVQAGSDTELRVHRPCGTAGAPHTWEVVSVGPLSFDLQPGFVLSDNRLINLGCAPGVPDVDCNAPVREGLPEYRDLDRPTIQRSGSKLGILIGDKFYHKVLP